MSPGAAGPMRARRPGAVADPAYVQSRVADVTVITLRSGRPPCFAVVVAAPRRTIRITGSVGAGSGAQEAGLMFWPDRKTFSGS
jgi:hypothetical protein